PVDPPLLGAQFLLPAHTPMAKERLDPTLTQPLHPLFAATAAVGVDRFVLVAGQVVKVIVLADAGGVIDKVGDDAVAVGGGVGAEAKVVASAFDSLAGAGIGRAGAIGTLGAQGSLDDGCVDDRALLQHQSLVPQNLHRLVQERAAVAVLAQAGAEAADGAVVGGLVVPGQADKAAETDAIGQQFLGHG